MKQNNFKALESLFLTLNEQKQSYLRQVLMIQRVPINNENHMTVPRKVLKPKGIKRKGPQ